MAGEPTIEIVCTTTRAASLSFTPSGRAVCNVDVAVNPRRKDGQSGEWKEQPAQFYRLTAWNDMAEHVSTTLDRAGIRVTARGRLTEIRAYLKDGEPRAAIGMDVDTIGPDLRFSPATVPIKAERAAARAGDSTGGHGGNQDPGGIGGGGNQQRAGGDPWATGPGTQEPPF